jgi:hypothetical protein
LRVGGDADRGERRTHIPGSHVPECQERAGAKTLRGSHVRNTLGSAVGLHLQPTEQRGRARSRPIETLGRRSADSYQSRPGKRVRGDRAKSRSRFWPKPWKGKNPRESPSANVLKPRLLKGTSSARKPRNRGLPDRPDRNVGNKGRRNGRWVRSDGNSRTHRRKEGSEGRIPRALPI